MGESFISTDRRKWKIIKKRSGKYFFSYKRNIYHLDNVDSKEECHVFTDKESNFLILVSDEKSDFASLIKLSTNCEPIMERTYAEVSTWWKEKEKTTIKTKIFF